MKTYTESDIKFIETNECCDICGTRVSEVRDKETNKLLTVVCEECEWIVDILERING